MYKDTWFYCMNEKKGSEICSLFVFLVIKRRKLILDDLGIEYEEAVGEAAFYGPKLDIQYKKVYAKMS